MKCEDLKELLESNDEKNARIKANTIECFEQIKDFVADEMIKKSIDSNFSEHGHSLIEIEVYRKLFEINGIDSSGVWGWWLSDDWSDEFRVINTGRWLSLNEDHYNKSNESKKQIERFFENFDRDLFKNLVENHLRSHGFKEVKIKNFHGRLVETDAFYASRSTIEKACCPDANPSQVEDSEEMNNGVIFAVVILAIILMALSFIIF